MTQYRELSEKNTQLMSRIKSKSRNRFEEVEPEVKSVQIMPEQQQYEVSVKKQNVKVQPTEQSLRE
jgi:heme oxygenase